MSSNIITSNITHIRSTRVRVKFCLGQKCDKHRTRYSCLSAKSKHAGVQILLHHTIADFVRPSGVVCPSELMSGGYVVRHIAAGLNRQTRQKQQNKNPTANTEDKILHSCITTEREKTWQPLWNTNSQNFTSHSRRPPHRLTKFPPHGNFEQSTTEFETRTSRSRKRGHLWESKPRKSSSI